MGFAFDLEQYRGYLRVLAQVHARNHNVPYRIDSSDLVQQTLLLAHKDREQFRGGSDEEMGAWLRQILARVFFKTVRALRQDKRDVARETSLQTSLDQSSARLQAWIASDQSSPTQRAQTHEFVMAYTEALATLSEERREAILLRYHHGLSIADVAAEMNLSVNVTAGIIRRGMSELRSRLEQWK